MRDEAADIGRSEVLAAERRTREVMLIGGLSLLWDRRHAYVRDAVACAHRAGRDGRIPGSRISWPGA